MSRSRSEPEQHNGYTGFRSGRREEFSVILSITESSGSCDNRVLGGCAVLCTCTITDTISFRLYN